MLQYGYQIFHNFGLIKVSIAGCEQGHLAASGFGGGWRQRQDFMVSHPAPQGSSVILWQQCIFVYSQNSFQQFPPCRGTIGGVYGIDNDRNSRESANGICAR